MVKSRFLRKREKSFSSNKAETVEQGDAYIKRTTRPYWSELLAHFSQIVMVGVVIFGYLFTVRPVFQKEQLAEKVAKLEIEEQHWDERLTDKEKELDERQLELAKLNTQTQETLNELQLYKKERDHILTSLDLKSKELIAVNNKLVTANQAVISAQQNLTEQIENQILGKYTISNSYLSELYRYNKTSDNWSRGYSEENPVQYLWSPEHKNYTKTFIKKFSQINPNEKIDILMAEIKEQIDQSHGIEKNSLKAIYGKYELAKKNKTKELSCPVLPLDEWTATYVSLDSIMNDSTEKCVNKTIERHKLGDKNLERFPGLDYYTSICEFGINRELIDLMQDKWAKVLHPCTERVLKINEIVLNDLKVDQLPPFGDLRPPPIDLITTQIDDYLSKRDYSRSILYFNRNDD